MQLLKAMAKQRKTNVFAPYEMQDHNCNSIEAITILNYLSLTFYKSITSIYILRNQIYKLSSLHYEMTIENFNVFSM